MAGRLVAAVFGVLAFGLAERAQAFPVYSENFATLYEQNIGCGNCHNGTVDQYTYYGLRLLSRNPAAGSAIEEMRAIEAEFAPFLSPDPGTVTLPAGTASVTLAFDPGLTFGTIGNPTPTASSLATVAANLPEGFTLSSVSGNSVTLSTPADPVRRGELRRDNPSGVPIQLTPKNTTAFSPTTSANLARNDVRVSFANLAPVANGASFTLTAAQTELSGNILARSGDTDPDGDGIRRVERLSDPAFGTITAYDPATGTFTYTRPAPSATDPATASFSYRLVDGAGAVSGTATVTITLERPSNFAPVAANDAASTDEDTAVVIEALANDSDPDGDALTVVSATAPSFGQVAIGSGGRLTYTPDADASGTDSFAYTVSDGTATATATVTVAVAAVNDAPTAQGDVFSTPADTALAGANVLANDTDVDSTALSAEKTGGDPDVTLAADGTVSFTPPDPGITAAATTSFTYRAVDDRGARSAPVTVTIQIRPVAGANTPPVARNDAFATEEDTPVSGNLLTDGTPDSDADGDPLTVSAVTSPAFGQVGFSPDGSFTYTPDPDATGNAQNQDRFDYTVTDGTDTDTARVIITITPVNDTPVARGDVFSTRADTALAGANVLANDTDVDSTALSAEKTGGDPDVTLAADGTVSFTPPDPGIAASTSVSFTYVALDDRGARSAEVTATIQIVPVSGSNDTPVASDDAYATEEDTPVSGNVLTDGTPDADVIGDPLTARLVRGPAFGTLALNADGSFTYTPDPDATGDENNEDSFEYEAFDGSLSDAAIATITITPVNDAPMARTVTPPAIDEQEGEQSFDLTDPAFVSDADGDRLSVLNLQDPVIDAPTLTSPVLTYTLDGTNLVFDPIDLQALDTNERARVRFDYEVSDGTAPPVAGSFTIEIIGLENGFARLAGEYSNTLAERYPGATEDHFFRSNVVNASCHTCHVVGRVQADIRTVADCNLQDLTQYGFDLCVARAGLDDPSPLTNLPQRLRAVEPGYAPRLTLAPSFEIEIDTAVGDPIGQPLAADPGHDVEGNASRVVDYTFFENGVPVPDDPNGLFRVTPDGQIRVAADLVPGDYLLDIRPINDAGQRDNAGELLAGRKGFYPRLPRLVGSPVTVTVRDVGPVAVDDGFNVETGTEARLEVTENDTGGTPAGLAIVAAPANGTATVSGLAILYTANAGFTGTDSLTYRTTNPSGQSDIATVTLTVVAPGGAIARDDTASTTAGQAVTVDVLANDGGANLTVSRIVTPPPAAEGTAAIVSNRIRFTPADGFIGTTSLVYEARNGLGASEATLSVSVTRIDGDLFAAATDDPELARVARALGDSCASLTTVGSAEAQDLLQVCAGIASDIGAGSDIDATLAAIRNEEALVVADQAFNFGRRTQDLIRRRIDRLKAGSVAPVDVSGMAVRIGDEALSGAQVEGLASAFLTDAEGAPISSRFGIFVAGEIDFADADATARRQGFDLLGLSVTLGADYRFSEALVAGIAASYAAADTDFADGGSLDGTSLQVSAYGLYQGFGIEGLSLTGIATYGFDSYDQARRIRFVSGGTTVDRTALSDFSGQHVNLSLTLGYAMPVDIATEVTGLPGRLDLFAGGDALIAWVDSYQETGAGGLNLAVDDQSYDSFLLTAGFEAAQPFYSPFGTVIEPYGRFSLNAELLDEERSLTARFLAAGPGAPGFVVTEDGRGALFATVEIGARLGIGPGELDLSYATTFGQEDLTGHRFSAGFRTPLFGNDEIGFGLNARPGGPEDLSLDAAMEYKLQF